MAYESQIFFTLDTTCPWTYIAKKRLDKALAAHAQSPAAAQVRFTIRFLPYQLHPDLPVREQDSPAAEGMLVAACVEAGLSEAEARVLVVEDRGGRGLAEVRRAIAEQRINGVDSVPWILMEGRKRDITLVGAKDVAEYAKVVQTIVRESS
ncbi:hypothetical protein MAPG_05550 [Magnaporthiopsis poae ATCC 64411]|uniref:DSBA-like thioredoxin domain-containing protein n=1 Tax=Magnaporthiopsis poae (strain ATCC 64411 / 73-15) TaxID=644358 RepID=A0A0C4DZP4_MAGP6|nr:hypothetical protein MAPG_05550 [Magnaporthiopsis poae ATCC 64411]